MAAVTAEAAEVQRALARLRRTTGLPVAFGGLVEPGRRHMRISELSGTATQSLLSLAVASGNGLGGRTVAPARPCAVTDHSVTRQTSHEYGIPVATEGLRSVVAVPVVVRRRVRGVLYGGTGAGGARGAACAGPADRGPGAAGRAARRVRSAGLRTAGGWGGARTRWLDILACVVSGARNAVAAEWLGLRPETVKGYLRSAMRRLGAHSRWEAVVTARRAGPLP